MKKLEISLKEYTDFIKDKKFRDTFYLIDIFEISNQEVTDFYLELVNNDCNPITSVVRVLPILENQQWKYVIMYDE